MQTGDRIQIKQQDGGRFHWIYARVGVPNADGSAMVIVDHPMNIEHGALKAVSKDEIRTQADVLAAAAAIKGSDKVSSDQRRSLLSQADWLTEEKPAPAAS